MRDSTNLVGMYEAHLKSVNEDLLRVRSSLRDEKIKARPVAYNIDVAKREIRVFKTQRRSIWLKLLWAKVIEAYYRLVEK